MSTIEGSGSNAFGTDYRSELAYNDNGIWANYPLWHNLRSPRVQARFHAYSCWRSNRMTIALTRVTVLSMLALLGGLSTNSCRAQAAEELATHDIAGQTGAEIDQPPLGPLPSYSWHIDSVPSHMQLITLVAEFPPTEGFHNGSEGVPLVSVLRDTLGDTDETNDRLRYIWLLTYARPTKMQRFFSAMPFFYRRISAGQKLPKGGVPKPLLDLSHTRKRVWTRLGGALAQWAAFNPQSMPIRTGTLAYRTNDVNGDRLHVE